MIKIEWLIGSKKKTFDFMSRLLSQDISLLLLTMRRNWRRKISRGVFATEYIGKRILV